MVHAVMPAASWAVELDHDGTVVNVGPVDPSVSGNTPPNGTLVRSSTADWRTRGDRPVTQRQVKAEEIEEGHVGWKPST